jgi:hypothetical protein
MSTGIRFGKLCRLERFWHYGSLYQKISDHAARLILDDGKRQGPVVRFSKLSKVQETPK